MTSQVIVYNLHGIALASDTVVTITVDGRQKTLEGTHKIYEIGKTHNVLVMHSGSVNINGIPHSLHISEWAKTLAEPLPTIAAYMQAYLEWSASPNTLSAQIYEDDLALSLIYERLGHLRGLAEEVDPNSPTAEHEIEELFELLFSRTADSVANYSNFTDDEASTLVAENYMEECEVWINQLKSDFKLSERAEEIAYTFCTMALSRMFAAEDESTIAFVGYGTTEAMPTVIAFNTPGVYAGMLRTRGIATSDGDYRPIEDEDYLHLSAASGYDAEVITLAQDSAIQGFLRGFVPDALEVAKHAASDSLRGHMKDSENAFLKVSLEIHDTIGEVMSEYAEKRKAQLLTTVSAMQVESLAEFADALVGIQALSTYSDLGTATVGGLIEVATIDRTNGIQWKRSLKNTNSF